MPSLKNRVADQRDILIAHSTGIRWRAKRIHTRLGHPVVLVPAFLSGILFERATPLVLRAIPELNSQLVQFTDELRKLNANVKLIAGLVPVALNPFRSEVVDIPQEKQPGSKT